MQEKQYTEDEIDLKELFNTIWEKRLFVAIFTLIVTLCAGIYVFVKTPIYEVKSIIEIGFIEKQLVEDSSVIEQKLNVIFNVDDKNINNDPKKGIISSIIQMKTVKNFIEVKTEAVSNEIAKEKIKEILDENGQKIAVDFVSTGNNHHVAIYEDENGNLQEKVVSFYEAVERVNQNLPVIDKEYN